MIEKSNLKKVKDYISKDINVKIPDFSRDFLEGIKLCFFAMEKLGSELQDNYNAPCEGCSHFVKMCEHRVIYGSHDCKVLRR